MADNVSKRVTVRMTNYQKNMADALAEREGMNLSQFIKWLIAQHEKKVSGDGQGS